MLKARQGDPRPPLDAIYAAVDDHDRLATLTSELAKAAGCSSVELATGLPSHSSVPFSIRHGIPDAAWASYLDHYWRMDPFLKLLAERGPPPLFELEPSTAVLDLEHHQRSAFFGEYLQQLGDGGVLHTAAADLTLTDGVRSFIGLYRDRRRGPFEGEELRQVNAWLPHLAQVIRLSSTLARCRSQLDAVRGVLALLPRAVLLLDASLRLEWANPAAQALCDRHPSLVVVHGGARGRLGAPLAAAAESVRRSDGELVLPATVTTPSGRLRFILCAGSRSPAAALGRSVVVFADDGTEASVSPTLMTRHFGVTSAEARVVVGLAGGRPLTQVATSLGIGHETARSQLKSVFRRLQVGSQAELLTQVFTALATSISVRDGTVGET